MRAGWDAARWFQVGFRLRVEKHRGGIFTWKTLGGCDVLDQTKHSWVSSLPCRGFCVTGKAWWAWFISVAHHKKTLRWWQKALCSLSLTSLSFYLLLDLVCFKCSAAILVGGNRAVLTGKITFWSSSAWKAFMQTIYLIFAKWKAATFRLKRNWITIMFCERLFLVLNFFTSFFLQATEKHVDKVNYSCVCPSFSL